MAASAPAPAAEGTYNAPAPATPTNDPVRTGPVSQPPSTEVQRKSPEPVPAPEAPRSVNLLPLSDEPEPQPSVSTPSKSPVPAPMPEPVAPVEAASSPVLISLSDSQPIQPPVVKTVPPSPVPAQAQAQAQAQPQPAASTEASPSAATFESGLLLPPKPESVRKTSDASEEGDDEDEPQEKGEFPVLNEDQLTASSKKELLQLAQLALALVLEQVICLG